VNKEQKAEVVDQIAAQIKGADAVYAVDYRGLSVTQAAELRAKLREAGTSFRIVKNTLTLRAGDAAIAAKALGTFARQAQVLALKGGVLGGRTLTIEELGRLARLPGRDQLNAQLAGIVASPITGLVRGLGSLLSGLAIALGQVQEKRAAEGPAEEPQPEAEEPAAEEPAAEEQPAEASGEEGGDQSEESEQPDQTKEAEE
jgi:large subunit ribosomal protein L10